MRFFAANPGQQLTARFLEGGVRVESGRGGQWQGTLRFTGLPGEAASAPLPAARENRVEYHHADGLTEWYENRAEGIEHCFTVSQRPESASKANQLRVDVRLEGLSARPVSDETGSARPDAVRFHDPESGRPVISYGKLKVWDATGRELAARLEARDSSVAILVADAGATYPVTIDPLIVSEEGKLLPEFGDGAASDAFGTSVALSGDTAVIGVTGSDTPAGLNAGSAYVFVRAGDVWSLQQKLIAVDGASGDNLGGRVAIDADTVLVGAWAHDHPTAGANAGAAYVFVRSGTAWSFQQKLLAGTPEANTEFGFSVALSGDTAAVGAVRSNTFRGLDTGVAYTFVRSGGVWTQQAILVGGEVNPGDLFAYSVALDGDTLLVGTPYHDVAFVNQGAAFVFVRNASSWTQQQRLLPHDGEFDAQFGISVELSGNTAVIGAPLDDLGVVADAGSAYVFVRSSTVWSQEQQLSAPPPVATDRFGRSVSVDGDTMIIGANVGSLGRAYVFVRSGALWSLETQLAASDAESNSGFGNSVAVSGSTALIGTVLDDTGAGADAGSAYVFVRNGTAWSQQTLLTAGDSAAGDQFGVSVALAGDTALIGAYADDTAAGFDTGSAYVFVRSGTVWTQQTKLTASDGAMSDNFGRSISITGDTALVGAHWDNTVAGEDAGSAYVFVRSGAMWTQQAKLTAGDAVTGDYFGLSVAVAGDTALVGATLDGTTAGSQAGSAYVFVRSGTTWVQQAKLTVGDGAVFDRFGASVALVGDTALVGAYVDDTAAGDNAGSAYVFLRSGATWSQQAKLTAGDGAANDFFGLSVALAGDTALIGAFQDDTPAGSNAGSAYVFVRSGSAWSQQAKLTAGDSAAVDFFGRSVALAGDTALIGAVQDDNVNPLTGTSSLDTGSAYVFRLQQTPEPTCYGCTAANPGRSAKDIQLNEPGSSSGIYWIDPDGPGGGKPFQVYCDMTTAGGGWMLAVNSVQNAEAPGTDMTVNVGDVGLNSGHTRNLASIAISQAAQLRFQVIDASGTLDAWTTFRYHDALPTIGAWFALPGHNGFGPLSPHFGQPWSVCGGVPWYAGACPGTMPSWPSDGLSQGPVRYQNDGILPSRFSIWVREVSLLPQAREIAIQHPAGTDLFDISGSIGFGSVANGSSSAPKTFTILNRGTETLLLNGIGLIGIQTDFIVDDSAVPASLPVGGSATFTVRFAPTATGFRSAYVQVFSNDPDENPFDILVAGTGLNAPPVAGTDAIVRLDTSVTAKVLLADLLANDTDADGDPRSTTAVDNAQPAGATVVIVGNWVVYTAPAINAGSGSFAYTLSDGPGGHSVTGTVTVTAATPPPPDGGPNPVAIVARGADFRVTFIGVPGRGYRVQYTTDPAPPYHWSDFIPPALFTAPANGVFGHTDVNPPNPVRLYRAVSNP